MIITVSDNSEATAPVELGQTVHWDVHHRRQLLHSDPAPAASPNAWPAVFGASGFLLGSEVETRVRFTSATTGHNRGGQ
ncbi:hypothetical protein ACOMHN_030722 [Nucella lapillus]